MKSVDSPEGLINNNIYLVGRLSSLQELKKSEDKTGGGGSSRRKSRSMPDGARNGISGDKTSVESEFGMGGGGGEDKEDDNDDRLWKKSFNHAFIFDLFRAAVDGKMMNGSRKWSSTGPRDADYVMLVLNQKLKENEELMMLLDRLKSMGVPCIFFSSSDLRTPPQNGSIKSTSALESGTQHNGLITQGKILKGPTLLVSPPVRSPIIPVELPPLPLPPPPVDLNNHLEDLDEPPPGEEEPQLTSTNVVETPEISQVLLKTPKTKRKRRRKYPYLTRKPVKRKVTAPAWKGAEEEEEKKSPLKVEIPAVSPSSGVDDPYAFTPEDDDDDDLPLELLHSPKKRRKNGLPKEASLNRAKAAVIARVFGDISCSLSPSKESGSSGERSGSPDNAKSPKKPKPPPPAKSKRRKQKAIGGRKKKAKGGKIKVQKTKSCVQVNEREEEESLMISGEDVSKAADAEESSLTQLESTEVIRKDEVKEESLESSKPEEESEVPREKEETTQNETKVNGALLPDFLSLFDLKPKTDASLSVPVEPEQKEELSTSSSSTATESTKCSALLEPNVEEAQQVISPGEPTAAAASSSSTESVSELKLMDVELPPEIMMPPPPPPLSKDSLLAPAAATAGPSSDQMTLRRPSFYSLIAGNVRNNMENFLDGRMSDVKDTKPSRRRKRAKNGFLLHHGDNFPEDPEAPYKLHLATQILLKLNKRRAKFKPKEDKGKSLLSYLKLVPKRASRAGKNSSSSSTIASEDSLLASGNSLDAVQEPSSVFTGEWVQERNFICNVCGHVEDYFWDMVMHKGEIHPGVVVTHVELPDMPPEGFRVPPPVPDTSMLPPPPCCTKCQATFNTYPDLHRHIFECAGNVAWLDEPKPPKKKKASRKKGFKRRLSNSPRKKPEVVRKVRTANEVFKCEFCTREFKTEGWLKNHVVSHSLPISIPLSKLTIPPSSSSSQSSRRSTIVSLIAASKSHS